MIRRISPDDVEVYRQIRLRALADSPSSFGSTYAAEAAFPHTTWTERVVGASTGNDRAMFLAFDGTECIGLVGCIEGEHAADKQLISMWVAPSYRGTGVAADLVDTVLAWASDSGAPSVELWITRGNDRARRLYERLGFTLSGDVQPLPWDPSTDELRMVYGRPGSGRVT